MVRSANRDLESQLGNGALAKKAVVTQQYSDQLWTDPVTQEVYRRYPIVISQFTARGLTLRDSVTGSTIAILEYSVPDGVELQFIPNYAEHFILGSLRSAAGTLNRIEDYDCMLQVWDQFEQEFRGTVWRGTTREVNDSDVYRQNGHPLCYNGDKEIRAAGGDLVQFKVTTPAGGTAIDFTPTGVSTLALKCYQLTRIRG